MALWIMVVQAICRPAEAAIGWHSWRMVLEKRETLQLPPGRKPPC